MKIGCWTGVQRRELFLRTCMMQMQLQTVTPDVHLIVINGDKAVTYDLRCVDDLISSQVSILRVPRSMTTLEVSRLAVQELLSRNVELFFKIDSDDIYKRDYIREIVKRIESHGLRSKEKGFCINLRNQLWLNGDSRGGASINKVGFRNGLGLSECEKQAGMQVGAPPTYAFDRRVAELLMQQSECEPYRNDHSDDRAWRRILYDHADGIECFETAEPVFGYLRHGTNTCQIAGENRTDKA